MKSEKPAKAVIYTRVSTGQQHEHGTSLAGQFEACKRKAQELGATVVSFFEETKSGRLYITRGELQKALAVIERGEANVLIVARLDRAGREVESLRDIRRRIEIAGGRLVFADGMNFEQSAVGDLLHTQLSGFAEFERALIRERTMAGHENKARAGLMPTRSKAPYGYRLWLKNDLVKGECSSGDVGRYALVPERAKWISPLFERIADGVSLRGACAWLSQSGAQSSEGRPWNPATIRNMIRNPIYKGCPAWRKTRSVTDEGRAARGLGIGREIERPETDRIYLEAPALVTASLWDGANQVLERGREERSGRAERRYLLTGLLRCPRCGARLYSRSLVQKRGEKTYRNHVYKCAGTSKRQARGAVTCDLPTMGGKVLERFVLDALIELLTHPDIVKTAQREWVGKLRKENATRDDAGELQRLRREIEASRKREDEAVAAEIEARLQGNDGGAFARFRLKAEEARRELERREKEVASRVQNAEQSQPDILPVAARVVAETLSDDSLSDQERAALLRPLVGWIYPIVLPDRLRVSARQMREEGKTVPDEPQPRGTRFCGGCDIVLRRSGACYIFTRRIARLEPALDSHKRATLLPVCKADLRIETASPFPLKPGRRSPLDAD